MDELIKIVEIPSNNYFRILRAYFSLSVSEVCNELGISQPTLIRFEKGDNSIKFDTVVRLNEFYKKNQAADLKEITSLEILITKIFSTNPLERKE